MFQVDEEKKRIEMNKGDFGIILTFTFTDIEGTDIKFKIYETDDNDKKAIVEKIFNSSDIEDNKIKIELTEEESNKLNTKNYYWGLYQYIKDELKNTLIVDKIFKVKEGV